MTQELDKALVESKLAEEENRAKRKIAYNVCPFDTTMRLANQISNPLQLLVEVLKTHID